MKYFNNKYDNHYNYRKKLTQPQLQQQQQLNEKTLTHFQKSIIPRINNYENDATHLMIPNSQTQRNVDNSEIRKLFDLLSLLLDWQLPSLSRSNDPFFAQASQPTSASEGSSDSIGANNNNIINNTICFWLLQCAPMELPVASQLPLVTFYHVSLPESFDGFIEQSRNSMARYCLNSVSELIKKCKSRFYGNRSVRNSGTPTGSAPRNVTNPNGASHRRPPKQYKDMLATTGRLLPPNRKTNKNSPKTKTSGPSSPYLHLNDGGGGVDSDTTHRESINSSGKVPLSVLPAINAQAAKGGAIRYGSALHNANSGKDGNNGSNSDNNNSDNSNGFNRQESGFVKIDYIVASSVIYRSSDIIKMSLACDYLAEIIQAWFVFVNDIESLLKTLLDLKNFDYPLLSLSASNTLLRAGCAMPKSFLKIMGNEALLIIYHSTPQQTSITILCSASVPTNGDMLRASFICYLDPSAPRLRKALLQATTASSHVLGALSLDNKGKRQSESGSIAGSIISPRNHTILVQDVISIVMNIHHMHEMSE